DGNLATRLLPSVPAMTANRTDSSRSVSAAEASLHAPNPSSSAAPRSVDCTRFDRVPALAEGPRDKPGTCLCSTRSPFARAAPGVRSDIRSHYPVRRLRDALLTASDVFLAARCSPDALRVRVAGLDVLLPVRPRPRPSSFARLDRRSE